MKPQKWIDFKKQRPKEGQEIIVMLRFPTQMLVLCEYSNDDNVHKNGIEFNTQTGEVHYWCGDDNIQYWCPAPTMP